MSKLTSIIGAMSLLSASATLAVPTEANAFPVVPAAAIATAPLAVEKTAYFYEGREYCFYATGWRGPGYYLCGFPLRRGFYFAPGFRGFRGGVRGRGFHGGRGHFGGGRFGGHGHFGGGRMGAHGGGGHMGGHGGGGHMGGHGGGHGGHR